MGFKESVRKCLKNYATFEGRATRSEFWWFYLFATLVTTVAILPGYILVIAGAATTDAGATPGPVLWIGVILLGLGSLVALAFIIPIYAVGCRRLHDRGQSGWLQLLLLVPCGHIVLLIFWLMDGTPGDNAYGPKPT